MTKNLSLTLIAFYSLLFVPFITKAQVTLLQDYQNLSSAAIGTFQGINFREGGFSALFPIANTNGKEFWTCSDRGVNVDCGNANPASCRPTYDKMFSFPAYAPKIHRIRINNGAVQILQTITIKRPNWANATGLINPTGLGSLAAETASTDTVSDCANFSSKIAAKDTFGIDPEAIFVDKDGNFWLSEEGGATIWKCNSNGVLIKRYTPYANLPGAQPVDAAIDTVFKYRKNNRGFENLTITPNGKIYAIIQSPLLFPTKAVGEATRVHRILEIDPATNNQRMFVYLNDGIFDTGSNQIRLQDWKLGDVAAINDSTFLILEAAARGTNDIKRVYLFNINQATAVHSGLYGTSTLEGLVDSTGLSGYNIKPVKKTLLVNLLAAGWPSTLDKAEGLAIINDSTIALCNDNDFAQTCPLANGIPIANANTSHVITFLLSGSSKLPNYKAPVAPLLNQGLTGSSSSQNPYIVPVKSGVTLTSILTTTDTIGGYKMCGIPDGIGAFDNGNGTFTLLMNHELNVTAGVPRAHGNIGSFVSKWVINKNDLSVLSGSDLIRNVKLWNGTGYTTFTPTDTTSKKTFGRFCSADLPLVPAFYNAATGKGTQERIFMNGEETNDESRAFAHIVTGTNAGTSYELPFLGKGAWENAVASPNSKDTTIVALTNDGTDGQVYFYIGTKTTTGTEIDKAGLSNGRPWGVKVSGFSKERVNSTTLNPLPITGTRFTLVDVGSVENMTGAAFNTASNTAGITSFSRPEDGAWDPSKPNDFYFNTTDQLDQVTDGIGSQIGRSRVWRVRFDDITKPSLGGTIEAVLDGTEGINMLDNLTIDNYGHILLNEDVGNAAHNGKVWQYTIATDQLVMLAKHDPARFGDIGVPATSPFNQDEETSGILDMESILGKGKSLMVDQAHYLIAGEAVEGGQLMAMFNPDSYNGKNVTSILTARAATAGDTVRIRGTITREMGRLLYMQDATAGIAIFQSTGAMFDSIASGGLKEGDSIEVIGARANFSNYQEISLSTGLYKEFSMITKIASNRPLPAPTVVTLKQINQGGEQYESMLLKVVNLKAAVAGTFGAATNYVVWDGSTPGDTMVLRTLGASDTELDDAPALAIPNGLFTFEGTLGQFCSSPSSGCLLGYQLQAVRKKDITPVLTPFNLVTPANNLRIVSSSADLSTINFKWNMSPNAVSYKWFLTPAAGSFNNPWISSAVALTDTSFTYAINMLDTLAATKGIAKGDSILLKWTAYAYLGSDSIMAAQANTINLVRFKLVQLKLNAFNLVSPPNNSRFVVEQGNTTPINITWTKSANATQYKWFVTNFSGSFKLALPSNSVGSDTVLTLVNSNIEALIASSLGINKGDSVNLTWTVYAYKNGTDSLKASQNFNINLVRFRKLQPFSLSLPANNTRLVVDQNETTPVVISWQTSATGATYKWFLDAATGNFSNPWSVMGSDNGGTSNQLNLTAGGIDNILNAKGVIDGDSVNLKWTVRAYDSGDSMQASQNFNIKAVRKKVTGINEHTLNMVVKLYPNPAGEYSTLLFSLLKEAQLEVSVIDMQGRILLPVIERAFGSGEHLIDVQTASLQNGVYFLKIGSANATTEIKLVVMH